jgi:hypothetical protein
MGGVLCGTDFDALTHYRILFPLFPNTKSPTLRQVRRLFPTVVVTDPAWKNSPALRTQALKFVQVISQTVKNLKRPDYLTPYLQEIGARHVKVAVERGFSSDYWPVFRDAIYATMKKRIESGWHKGYGHNGCNSNVRTRSHRSDIPKRTFH